MPRADPIDLDALDDYLMSDHAPDDSMGLSDLDGFLTGIVVGPELILPSEWLPVIWGGEEPVFETEDEMRTVLGTIMGRYNEIVACLDTDPDDFDPILLEGPEGKVIASDWAPVSWTRWHCVQRAENAQIIIPRIRSNVWLALRPRFLVPPNSMAGLPPMSVSWRALCRRSNSVWPSDREAVRFGHLASAPQTLKRRPAVRV